MKWFTDIRKYYVWRALIKRFSVPILVVHMLLVGISVEQIAVIAAVGYVVSLIFEAPSGAFADTIGHKHTLVIAGLLQSVSMLLYFGGTFWWFFAAIVLFYFGQTLITGTGDALLYERIKEDGLEKDNQKISGRARATGQGFGIISMLLCGIAYTWHWWLPFAIGALQFLTAAYVISGFRAAKQTVSVKEQEGSWEVFRHLARATKTVWHVRSIFWISMMYVVVVGVFHAAIEFQQVLFTNVSMTAAVIGVVYACKRLCGMLAALSVHRMTDKFGSRFFMIIGASSLFLSLIIVMLAGNAYWLVAAVCLGAASYHSFVVVVNDQINELTKNGSRATTLSVANMFLSFFSMSLILIVGWASSYGSIERVYGALGIVGFALLLLIAPQLFHSLAKKKVSM